MLNVLLESRAARPRRMGGTLASAVAHGVLIAWAVALTLPEPGDARDAPPDLTTRAIFVPLPDRRPAATGAPASPREAVPSSSRRDQLPRTIEVPIGIPDRLPPIDVGLKPPADEVRIGSGAPRLTGGVIEARGLTGAVGDVLDAGATDRPPRMLGSSPVPRYPDGLRAAGFTGRVVVQVVVDTTGRAEMDQLQIVEASHPSFADAVRASLPRHRFVPGEAGGRKVRTRVQIPFEFALTR